MCISAYLVSDGLLVLQGAVLFYVKMVDVAGIIANFKES